MGAASLAVMRGAQEQLSARALAQGIAAQARPTDAVWSYGIYLHGLPFYLKRRVDKMVLWVGELGYARRDPANADRFGDDSDVRRLPLQKRRAFVVMREFEARHFISLTAPDSIADHGRFGRWELAEFLAAEEMPGSKPRRRSGLVKQ